ncbi:MAG: Hsp20/alpha crystallin family protein [Crocinitomicaceae bacterium]|nr:Hsp20/alpha crystallin family protein [Crocinitomicaceae bacterium]
MLGNVFNNDWLNFPQNFKEQFGTFPAANVKESEKDFTIELAVPGKNKDDFKIDLDENILTISSEEKETKEEKSENYTRREYSYQSFRRSFKLPETANEQETAANYTDGILKIVIPKKDSKKQSIKSISVS